MAESTETAQTTNGMTVEQITVTPAMAGEWLTRNQNNRHESPWRVRRYANDMTEGRWMLTHQPIAFDENDDVLDGQNRLLAVIRANMAQPFLVVRGAPRASFYVVDTGKPRSLADALTIEGEPNARNIAAFTNLLWRTTPGEGIDDDGMPAPGNPGTARALEFWEPRRHGLQEATGPMHHVYYYLHGPMSAYGGLYYRFAELDKDDADLFYDKLAVGTHMKEDDPVNRLRNHILSFTRAESMHHMDRIHVAALMTIAFNLFRDGKTARQLTWRRGGSRPEPFPQPK